MLNNSFQEAKKVGSTKSKARNRIQRCSTSWSAKKKASEEDRSHLLLFGYSVTDLTFALILRIPLSPPSNADLIWRKTFTPLYSHLRDRFYKTA